MGVYRLLSYGYYFRFHPLVTATLVQFLALMQQKGLAPLDSYDFAEVPFGASTSKINEILNIFRIEYIHAHNPL